MGLHRTPRVTARSAAPVGRPDVGGAHRPPSRRRLGARRRLCSAAGGTTRGTACSVGTHVVGPMCIGRSRLPAPEPGVATSRIALAGLAPATTARWRPARGLCRPGSRVPPPTVRLTRSRRARRPTTAAARRRATRGGRRRGTTAARGPGAASAPPNLFGLRTRALTARDRSARRGWSSWSASGLGWSHEGTARIARLVPECVGTTPTARRTHPARRRGTDTAGAASSTPAVVGIVAPQNQSGAGQ